MDDKNFQDSRDARDWIEIIEQGPSSPRELDIYPAIRRLIESTRPAQVLDIGCGQGICCLSVSESICHYTGVDPSLDLCQRAQELYASAHRTFVLGNIYQLPFADQTFEAAFSIAVWHLLEHPLKAAQELARVLKPGAHFFIVTAHPKSYDLWTQTYTKSQVKGPRFEGWKQRPDLTQSSDVLFLYSRQDIEASLSAAKLSLNRHEAMRPSSTDPHRSLFIAYWGSKDA